MEKRKLSPSEKDCLSAIIFFVFGILMLAVIIPVGIPVGFVPPGQISPRFLPNFLSAAITFVAALMLLLHFFKRIKSKSSFSKSSEEVSAGESIEKLSDEKLGDEKKSPKNLKLAPILSIIIIVVYFLLLIFVGFIPSSIFAMIFTMLMFDERRWYVIVTSSILIPLAVWVFATKLLHLPMP